MDFVWSKAFFFNSAFQILWLFGRTSHSIPIESIEYAHVSAVKVMECFGFFNFYWFFFFYRENSEEEGTSHKRIKLDCADESPEKAMNELPVTAESNGCIPASSLTCFHLRPNRGLDRSGEPQLNADEYVRESIALAGFTDSLDELKRAYNKQGYANDVLGRAEDYPKIVFLGTGSCIPNKTRNVSSILMHTSESACILLDCGEGTASQLRRFYGGSSSGNVEEVFGKLKAIYISHLHADHHIGKPHQF